MPGSDGYWAYPSATVLVENGVKVDIDPYGLLKNVGRRGEGGADAAVGAGALSEPPAPVPQDDPTFVNCKPPGGPRQFQQPFGIQFVEDRERQRIFVLIGGGNRNFRIIYIDGRGQVGQVSGDDDNPLYYGRAVGKWEGSTSWSTRAASTRISGSPTAGLPHTDQLRLIERFTRVDFDTLRYEVTVEDPGAYTRPWTVRLDHAMGRRRDTSRAFLSGQSALDARSCIDGGRDIGRRQDMRAYMLGGLVAVALFLAAGSLQAHHSFAAEFDANKPITLKGIVTKIEWTNPHVWFYVNVKDEKTGEVTNWGAEMGPPHGLQRRGWRRDTLKIGEEVTVAGSLAKNGSKRMNARTVTLTTTGGRPGETSTRVERRRNSADSSLVVVFLAARGLTSPRPRKHGDRPATVALKIRPVRSLIA